MDWFAVVSLGAYPSPTPTGAQRAAFGASYGLLDSVSAAVVSLLFYIPRRLGLGLGLL
jgi:hypothetical protein